MKGQNVSTEVTIVNSHSQSWRSASDKSLSCIKNVSITIWLIFSDYPHM